MHQRLLERSQPLGFRTTMGLPGGVTLGVGALMGAGLYVLVGHAASETGAGAWVAYAACGALTFLTVLVYARLARRLPVSGGGYVYAYRQLGSFWGFIVGWHLAVGSIFACALYASGFGFYLGSFLPSLAGSTWAPRVAAAAATILLTLAAVLAGRVGERLQKVLTWGNVAVLLILSVGALLVSRPHNLVPVFPRGIGGVAGAVSIIYISFFGYQLIANNAEEIRDPARNVPRAMILSLLVACVMYVVVAVIAVAAVPWRQLAASDAPLALVASRALGPAGLVLVGAGGILASAAALNSTLVSQARQIFAMGRDRLLPRVTGRLTRAGRIPAVALVMGGAVTVLVVLVADVAFIARIANFSLLLSLLPVSWALHSLQRHERVSLPARLLPFLTLVANGAMLLTLDGLSLAFGGGILVTGCLVFLGYSHVSEKRGRAEMSIRLDEDDPGFPSLLRKGECILVPQSNPATQEALMSISQAILLPAGGEIVVLSVVRKKVGLSPRKVLHGLGPDHRAIRVLERVSGIESHPAVKVRPVIRAAEGLPEGIAHAAREEGCRLIVMGWASEDGSSPSALLDEVTSRSSTDVIFYQHKGGGAPGSVGVCLGGKGTHLPLMVRVASALAERGEGSVRYMTVVPGRPDAERMKQARQNMVEALRAHVSTVPPCTEIVCDDDAVDAIVRFSGSVDVLVIGSLRSPAFRNSEIGSFAARVAERAHCSVVVVRRSSTLLPSVLRR
jgi:amino acid transporter/nucleotide-binding universal stress UspA family protein